MQTNDFSPVGDMSFLSGNGEMAGMIRAYDWSDHPFGPPENWPQSLRSALSICLESAFPTAIYWGPDLRLLYNDAWAPIPGPRHPAALGAPAREVWADIWHVIEPQFERLLATGEGIFVQDQMLPMRRFGAPEETYWNYSFTPIRGEDGEIAGVFNSGSETTRNVLSRRKMRVMLELGEALRSSADPRDARRAALGILGEHLDLDRVGIGEVTDDGDVFEITDEWRAPGVKSIGPRAILSERGAWVAEELRAGHVIRVDDVENDPRIDTDAARGTFRAYDVAAIVAVPWMANGRLDGMAFLHSHTPRDWNDFEISTVEELIERTQSWIERNRAAARERIMIREIDHRARNVLAVAQSVVRLTRADDVDAYREKIEERIGALARAHALLAAERWHSVDLRTLLNQEVAPYATADAERVYTEGPTVALPPSLTQTVALVVHELATNAAKHGALAAHNGKLEVCWQLDANENLRIDWTETKPSPGKPAGDREGFGSTLLKRVVEAQLGGSLERRFTENGIRCSIEFPLNQTQPDIPYDLESESGAAMQSDGPKRAMIVEDEAIIAMDLEVIVRDLGYEIFGVHGSVAEALTATETDIPDFAILDANLHGESSLPVAKRLHAQGVPLIFATGYKSMSDLPASMEAVPKLTKPVRGKVLAAAIEKAIG